MTGGLSARSDSFSISLQAKPDAIYIFGTAIESVVSGLSRVLVLGAHPDDAESGCGGLIRNLVDSGTTVGILCMTRGEKAPGSNPPEENAKIRSEEAKRGASILGAEIEFLGSIDGEVVADVETSGRTDVFIRSWEPDVVLAHWPLDTHADHQACGIMALRSLVGGDQFEIYFYEVLTGYQTMNFVPTHFVDIGYNRDVKHEACMAHESQNPGKWMVHHELMETMRGREIGVEYAEAYVRASRSGPATILPGLDSEMQVKR
jgi:LmbE family N-acetylglucosaminyl deacetylase